MQIYANFDGGILGTTPRTNPNPARGCDWNPLLVAPDKRQGTITQLRHKYVARLHYVLEHYEARFPAIHGFRNMRVDLEKPDGLNEFIAELKGRREWIEVIEQEQYRNGPWLIALLAQRVGLDVRKKTAAGVASQGILLKVADQVMNQSGARTLRARFETTRALDAFSIF